jgi:hypothetical protein
MGGRGSTNDSESISLPPGSDKLKNVKKYLIDNEVSGIIFHAQMQLNHNYGL